METTHSTYLDFDLEIGPGSEREYPVSVHSPAGEAREKMHFSFDESALETRLLTLQNALLHSGGRHLQYPSPEEPPEERTIRDFGQELFNALFVGGIRSRYDVSRDRAEQEGKGLRLKLHIQLPQMAALPWEFLYDPHRAEYMCLSRHTSVIRYPELPQPVQPLTVTPPLRILGMIASPSGLPSLDVGREKQQVEEALRDLQVRGLVDLVWLEGQTWRALQETMWSGPWHIFHFVGHGGFDQVVDEGFIALADEEGATYHLYANDLRMLLADQRSMRLVLLNACDGGRGGQRDIFSSTASILIRQGIPAVLAMQYKITDTAAIELAKVFYKALAEGMPVDGAVAEARKAIRLAVTNTVEWGVPVLYMRSLDGVLFTPQKQRRRRKKQGEVRRSEQERLAREEAAREEAERKARQEAEWLEDEGQEKAPREERDRLDVGQEPEWPLSGSNFISIDISVFITINQRPFFEQGEPCPAGGMLIIPAWPDKAEQIEVSSAGVGKRYPCITASRSGQITIESWDSKVTPFTAEVSTWLPNWPHESHYWKFEPLDLKQSFQLNDGKGSFDHSIITAAWWIWHKADTRRDERFLILIGKT